MTGPTPGPTDRSERPRAIRVAVITGAGSGIGEASARLFAHEGPAVALWDLDRDALARSVGVVRSLAGMAERFLCDIASPETLLTAARDAVAAFGPSPCC